MAYATLDELKGRLDWTLDPDEERIAAGALEDASDLAAHYGRSWADDAAPRLVRTLVLKASARYMRNPGGYTQSRAGDETLGWSDAAGENAGTVYFTDEEQKLLASLGGKSPGIYTVEVTAWNSRIRPSTGYVPVDNGGSDYPFFAEGYE
ncbi:head-to-tail adaptor [Streptomyces phage OzzyJ]|uniref:Head-to-tail adaptor n=1 Tax=Streptomyces phage Werner TaxID=2801898 RepID=A0A7U0J7R0_9CAUD|nr:head-tail adaptor Ad1 [Streptomyces phage Werner]AVE00393.1 head-to-tail adaptor [Streptomyces phage OzzyJ]QAY17693.1 head-to-tail adaptor [Streptomyces phage Asten]QFP95178.1 head-to-tail adaptor [Streptomyces phage Whatever]QQO39626.1 head-to-tail adaptor [Streptomyces phage Hippo]QQO39933.1 head-to-tail adaptor [Streptomyces phage Dwayne]QZE11079.1 head-to-tail adaptor [Streptomyces phage SarahRose]UKH48513.1 head-to-tail adaptor [Streptomyces phage Snorlax]WAB09793.1 head-to-tail ada